MARRHSSARRRRRGRFNGILKLLFILLVIGALIAAMTLFFRVESIEVSGNGRYSEDEVIAASGIEMEDNLFLMDKYDVENAIETLLPYVETATLDRALPNTIVLEVSETESAAGIVTDGETWLISRAGKLLEKNGEIPVGCAAVTGAELLEPDVSAELSFGDEQSFKKTALLALLQRSEEMGIAQSIRSIDLSDDTALHFAYLDRFDVKLPWDSDISYKLKSLTTTVDYLEDNETGEINLLVDGQARFIPYVT